MNKFANCWPNAEQTLLLKAALISDKEHAGAYLNQFCNAVDIHAIDYSTTSMTPMIYKRFRNLDGEEIQVAKSVYRHTWSANNLSFHALRKVLLAFDHGGVNVTLLKGVAMITRYYRDFGLRVMGDIDILVPESQRKVAIDLLCGMGWQQLFVLDEQKLKYTHATPFRNCDGVNIDLHWRILSDAAFDCAYANFQPEYCTVHNLSAHTLCPEDQLLHTLIHCHKYSPVPLIRWIPDASVILNNTLDFRWDYFFEAVKTLKVEYIVRNALNYLYDEKFIDLPEGVLQVIQKLTWTEKDKKYFDLLTKPRISYFYFYFYIWLIHARNNPESGRLLLLISLPRFVMNSISIDSYWRLFKYELNRYAKYIYNKPLHKA